MFAVIETGGKQYLVETGKKFKIEKLPGAVGESITFEKVLLIASDDGSDVKLGKPYLEGTSISGVIEEQARDKKILVVKFKRKVRYKRVRGHRQHFTKVKIQSV